jgi:hypothetical protein
MPGQYQQLYTALGGGDIVRGYEIAMSGKQEGMLDKARLTEAQKFLDNPMNKINSPESYKQAQALVASSFMPILDSNKVNGPILQKPQR